MHVEKDASDSFAVTLYYHHMEVLFKYLGMIVGKIQGNKNFGNTWWIKLRINSQDGNVSFCQLLVVICLNKSAITILPLYYLSLFKAFISVCKSIMKIQWDFLWGWGIEGRKIVLIKWDNLCKPKLEGGLGIRHIEKANIALIAK